jgi:hypothetical protein
MNHLVKAGAEELIWLVVGVFWVIAQIAGNSAQKKLKERQLQSSETEDTDQPPVDGRMAELVRRLSGVQEIRIPEPPPPRELRKRHHKPTHRSSESEKQSAPEKAVRKTKLDAPKEITEMEFRPSMNSFRNAMPTIQLPSIKLPSMKLHYQCAAHHDRDVDSGHETGRAAHLNLKDRKALRRAMLNHVILSKPKAFE